MFSPETIRKMSADAARKSAREKKHPYVFADAEEVDKEGRMPLPFVGTYVAPGWKKFERDGEYTELFVDSSGFGSPGEPALTINQFRSEIKKLLRLASEEGITIGFAIVEAGQFQVHVGVFTKKGA